MIYETRPIKRSRATSEEIQQRHDDLVRLAQDNGPCSVRHLFYRAVVEGLPGITKNDSGYTKVQRGVLDLRRSGRIPYHLIVDSTRWVRRPGTWDSIDAFLTDVTAQYRRDLWSRNPNNIEVWCESESIAGTVADTTYRWGIPLFVCRGQSSETFTWNAAQAWRDRPGDNIVMYIGDHDPAGLEIEINLRTKLESFSGGQALWTRLGVTWEQAEALDLPGTQPKKPYGYPLAVEAEALPPRMLVDLLDREIAGYADQHELDTLLAAEESEREILMAMAIPNGGRP